MNFLMGTCNLFGDPKANYTFIQVIGTARLIVRVMQIAIPILLILMGTIDLGKAVVAKKEEDITKNRGMFVKRILTAILVYLLPLLVNLIIGYVSNDKWYDCWQAARDYNLNGDNVIKEINE